MAALWVVVGDSFARGTGAADGVGYPELLGRYAGHRVRVVAAGGCGFVNPGRYGTHRRRRWLVPGKRQLLIIQSSANDRRFDTEDIKVAMRDYLRRVRGSSPVAIIGAVWCGPADRDKLHRVTSAAHDVAREFDAQFIDTRRWELIESWFHQDGHPTSEGHAAIARLIAAELE